MYKKIKNVKKQASNEETKVPFMPSQASIIKPWIYDRKTSWQVYKMQFTMVTKANGWNHSAKAFHVASLLRGNAASMLKTLSEAQRHNFEILSSALELRFREKCTKEYSCLQLKSCYLKAGESLQELTIGIQKLSHFAFSDCPAETRENLAFQHFIDSVRDLETQKVLRLVDLKDIASSVVYAHKIETTQQASQKDQHTIRTVFATDLKSDFSKQIEELQKEI